MLANLLRRVAEAQPAGSEAPTEKDLRQLANAVQHCVLQMTVALRPSDTEDAIPGFVVAVVAAMHALVPAPGSADPTRSIAEVAKLLSRAKGAKS
jgi:hypothetical protein